MSALTSPLTPTPSNPMIPSEIALLPRPLAADGLSVGQLVSKDSKLNPSDLFDRDYDDVGCKWYKDVVILSTKTNTFTTSLGGTLLVQNPLDSDTEMGTIEAEEMRVRSLKDPNDALSKRLATGDTYPWIKEQVQKGDVGFVVAVREVTNASYKRATLRDAGNGNWEVVREVGGEVRDGKRRDSGLDVQTGSKRDAVGVIMKRVIVEGDHVTLGDELSTELFE
ncbi:hypothetical protein K491DRAFT_721933 [Lophiostoma macrostomum CBS 122681]|uniref:Uncharacterized protein n=1 Tax=Lophiostoma macrostomum CBS 122681 TaxID=1314788 RepID=A0A6A6SSJ4_9PLEO|nr:hypothetical protein K491DRAFT_721933 [Lophiostoma macrostomum CBS 122681]